MHEILNQHVIIHFGAFENLRFCSSRGLMDTTQRDNLLPTARIQEPLQHRSEDEAEHLLAHSNRGANPQLCSALNGGGEPGGSGAPGLPLLCQSGWCCS